MGRACPLIHPSVPLVPVRLLEVRHGRGGSREIPGGTRDHYFDILLVRDPQIMEGTGEGLQEVLVLLFDDLQLKPVVRLGVQVRPRRVVELVRVLQE